MTVRSSKSIVGGIKLINKKERVQCIWKQDLLTTTYHWKHHKTPKKTALLFIPKRSPEQSTSLHAFAIFATPWVPWQCEVLRNCAKDFWMPQSYAMSHALLDPHDASVFDYCMGNVLMWCEVLDNDSDFERQHGNQSSTFNPNISTAPLCWFQSFKWPGMPPWNFFLYQTLLSHLESLPTHGFIHHENGEVAPLTYDFFCWNIWLVCNLAYLMFSQGTILSLPDFPNFPQFGGSHVDRHPFPGGV